MRQLGQGHAGELGELRAARQAVLAKIDAIEREMTAKWHREWAQTQNQRDAVEVVEGPQTLFSTVGVRMRGLR